MKTVLILTSSEDGLLGVYSNVKAALAHMQAQESAFSVDGSCKLSDAELKPMTYAKLGKGLKESASVTTYNPMYETYTVERVAVEAVYTR